MKARCIQNAEISEAPPHVREIWDWLLKEANFKDMEYMGTIIKRGSCFTSYQEIRDGLSWRIGYRIQRYSKSQCETAMKYLTKHGMITTAKTTRGLLVTICKYEKYQDVKNYESYSEHETKATRKPQPSDTISKNEKKEKNVTKKEELKDIISHLNLRTKKNYNPGSKKTAELVNARINEGFTVDDFKAVIDNQTVKWLNDPKMCEYLRPETLFGTKFESYLNAPPNLAQANIVSPSSAGILGWAERKMQREGNNG